MMEDVMIDLETLGKQDNAVIVSIAAVQFDMKTGELGKQFFMKIDIDSSLDAGLVVQGSTIRWWLSQDLPARKGISTGRTLTLKKAMDLFVQWVSFIDGKDFKYWGNSNTFDLVKLKNSLRAVDFEEPWQYYNERDVRTLSALAPKIKDNMVFEGTKHDPVDDCKHQIKYCVKTFNTLKGTDDENAD